MDELKTNGKQTAIIMIRHILYTLYLFAVVLGLLKVVFSLTIEQAVHQVNCLSYVLYIFRTIVHQ